MNNRKLPANASTYTAVVLILGGLLMIYLGWNGAAGVEAGVDLRAQFPYLISGGVFGLALVGAGLMLVRVFEGRRDTQQVVAHLRLLTQAVERLEQAQTVPNLVETIVSEPTHVPTLPPAPAQPFEPAR